MICSAYLSLLDDWDILRPALQSVIDRVDEIVVVDGAYHWMTPYFVKSNRDPATSRPEVREALAEFGPKIRIINGLWENEMEKRIAGYDACFGRYRYRVDADEIYFFDENNLKAFFESDYAVGQMEMPTYIAPGLIGGQPGEPLPRQSFLFDSNKISAFEHLSYLWLVLPQWEREKCGEPRSELIYPESLAFNAHLTHWRPPTSSLSRARFYVMNYLREHGAAGGASMPTQQPIIDFNAFFERTPPSAFDDILLGRRMVVMPFVEQLKCQETPLGPIQEQAFAPLYNLFLESLATLNHKLLTAWRTIQKGSEYFLDATLPHSLPLGPEGLLAFEISQAIEAIEVKLSTYDRDAFWNTVVKLKAQINEKIAIVTLPPLPEPGSFLRRTLAISVLPQQNTDIFGFRLLSVSRAGSTPLEDEETRQVDIEVAGITVDSRAIAAPTDEPNPGDEALPEHFRQSGAQYIEAGDLSSASAVLSDGIARFPRDVWIGRLWGLAAKLANDHCEAARRLAHVRSHEDADFLAAEQADCLLDAGDVAAATAVLHNAQNLFPDSRWVHLSSIRHAARRGDVLEVRQRWEALEGLFPISNGDHVDIDLLKEKVQSLSLAGDFAGVRAPFEWLERLTDPASLALGPTIVGWVLVREPLIIVSGVYSFDAVVRPVMAFNPERPCFFFFASLMSLVFHTALRERLTKEFHLLSTEFQNAHIVFMANEIAELRLACSLGLRAVLVNNNAFVDTERYVIQPAVTKQYNAVYNARFMPYKRHELATSIRRLRLVMAGPKQAVFAGVERTARDMFPQAEINEQELDTDAVVAALNSARCGLCLSANEGAMYAAVEYLLCGLPIVTTSNVGGRDWWFSSDTAIWSADHPDAVAKAVDTLLARNVDPEHVRLTTLERIRRERLHFFDIVRQEMEAHGFAGIDIPAAFAAGFQDKANYLARPMSYFIQRSA